MNTHDQKLINDYKHYPLWESSTIGLLLTIPENLDIEITRSTNTTKLPLGKTCHDAAIDILRLQEEKRRLEEKVTALSRITIQVKA